MPGSLRRFFAVSAAGWCQAGSRSFVTSCRAVVLERFGGPEVLELRSEVGVPDLKPGEVLVRTRAVSVNPLGQRWRRVGRDGTPSSLPLRLVQQRQHRLRHPLGQQLQWEPRLRLHNGFRQKKKKMHGD